MTPLDIARAFIREMRRQLPRDALLEIDRRNRDEAEPRCCHSHDFTDSNQVMLDALDAAAGEGVAVPTSDDVELLSEAWMLARAAGFAGGERFIPLSYLTACGAVICRQSYYRQLRVLTVDAPVLVLITCNEYTTDGANRGATLLHQSSRMRCALAKSYHASLGEALEAARNLPWNSEASEWRIECHPADAG